MLKEPPGAETILMLCMHGLDAGHRHEYVSEFLGSIVEIRSRDASGQTEEHNHKDEGEQHRSDSSTAHLHHSSNLCDFPSGMTEAAVPVSAQSRDAAVDS